MHVHFYYREPEINFINGQDTLVICLHFIKSETCQIQLCIVEIDKSDRKYGSSRRKVEKIYSFRNVDWYSIQQL